jgi:hypothetical protein
VLDQVVRDDVSGDLTHASTGRTERICGAVQLARGVSQGLLDLGSTVERGFWAADGMMVQVGGLRLAANGETA